MKCQITANVIWSVAVEFHAFVVGFVQSGHERQARNYKESFFLLKDLQGRQESALKVLRFVLFQRVFEGIKPRKQEHFVVNSSDLLPV